MVSRGFTERAKSGEGEFLGTILGWVLSNLSQMGKLIFTESLWEDRVRHNKLGQMVNSTLREEAQLYSYELVLDVYNSSNETKIMRDVRMEFRKDGKVLLMDRPSDDTTRRTAGPLSFYDEVGPLNIPPKSVLTMKLHGGMWDKDERFHALWNATEIVLVYKDARGKDRQAFRKRISMDDCLARQGVDVGGGQQG